MSEIDALKQQIASIQARVGEMEAKGKMPVEEVVDVNFEGGVRRDAMGRVISTNTESYEDRAQNEAERQQAYLDEQERKSKEGLPVGMYRDPFGIVRREVTGVKVNLAIYTSGHDLASLHQRGKLLPGQDLSDLDTDDD